MLTPQCLPSLTLIPSHKFLPPTSLLKHHVAIRSSRANENNIKFFQKNLPNENKNTATPKHEFKTIINILVNISEGNVDVIKGGFNIM